MKAERDGLLEAEDGSLGGHEADSKGYFPFHPLLAVVLVASLDRGRGGGGDNNSFIVRNNQ